MSLGGIIALVLAAVIILALLFIFFHVFIALLPVALIAILVIWLIYHFSRHKNENQWPSNDSGFQDFTFDMNRNQRWPHKKARNVTTKDVDDDK